ncbi:(d)CMP kinase [Lactobacillus acetotolerans]|uniref:Uncharacterized protein n=2 Tax=Lactobacillus acetotolerans TaxID=1600 RepID=A0A5P5ZGA6_9LACO|nr:(d)CMP kinase [Lactobacillus acetotolerans]KRN37400.1 hypothetical protein FC77_GL001325 [Lactobacillus acetotolerans DSM 20749 = JCM 3825]MBN7277149.1 hypothetical protein [Lactobacillus acetotolerans]QFG50546.1 hypothetical protein LA749_00215 [Lactobacillus acetotolerans]GGV18471.1 hypothetical protein GCM10011628_14660 [Lactobacillus acetotolerans DSM 20749 = JCM 3825]
MLITDQQFEDKKRYVKGMFSLGGLSECGKSAAGLYLNSIGIKRMKIIQIEKEMMRARNYDFTGHPSEEDFVKLYSGDQEKVFREFLYRLIQKMEEAGTYYASIESLYRAELGAYLKKELGPRMMNIYIEAPIEVRAKREFKKQTVDNGKDYTFAEIVARTKKKDQFKIDKGAKKVKNIADIIINNDSFVENEQEYENIIAGIASIVKK